jgi:transposase
VLFWHLLTREEDYAFERPSLTRRTALELKTEEGWRGGRYSGPRVHETEKEREHEREFAEQIETAYRRLTEDWQPKPPRSGAGATRGRASSSHLLGEETAARQG